MLVWSDIRDALAGKSTDIVVGRSNLTDSLPQIGRNKTFIPGGIWYDGRYLWVGELKFANRLLRFSPPASK